MEKKYIIKERTEADLISLLERYVKERRIFTAIKLVQSNEEILKNVKIEISLEEKREIFSFAKKGKVEKIENFLSQTWIDLNMINKRGKTILMCASMNGHTEIVRLLLSQPGIEINAIGYNRNTPLICAAENGHTEIVQLLLSQPGIDINIRDGRGKSAIMCAYENEYTEILQLLFSHRDIDEFGKNLFFINASRIGDIETVQSLLNDKQLGININARDTRGKSAIVYAYENKHAEMFQLLISHININKCGKSFYLLYSSRIGDIETVQSLLNNERLGIDINARDTIGKSAIMYAYENKHAEMLQLLFSHRDIDKFGKNLFFINASRIEDIETVQSLLNDEQLGIDINATDTEGKSAIVYAYENEHAEMFQLLISHININKCGKSFYLLYSSRIGDIETVQALLNDEQLGININTMDYTMNTSLILAVENGHIEVVQLLLSQPGINVNAKNKFGYNSLYYAVTYENIEIVRILLSHPGIRIDINAKDNDERTALMYAVENGHREIVQLLLSYPGIDINLKDNDGYTSLILAAINGHREIVQLLLSYPYIDINSKDNDGNTPLILAAKNGHTEIVRLLLSQLSIELNAKDNDEHTALMYAAKNGHTEIVRLLLSQLSIELNAKDNDEHTALMYAVENGHRVIVRLLLLQPSIELTGVNTNKLEEIENNINILDLYFKSENKEAANLLKWHIDDTFKKEDLESVNEIFDISFKSTDILDTPPY